MSLEIEEKIMVELMTMYTLNSFSDLLNLSEYFYEESRLLEVIERCRNAGIILYLIENGRLINVPDTLLIQLNEMYDVNRHQEERIEKLLNAILLDLRKSNIKCVIGGEYAISKDYLSKGDIYLDEIVLFVNNEIDIYKYIQDDLTVKIYVKSEEFFEENYNECLRYNMLPLNLLYEEYKTEMQFSNGFNNKLVILYILHQILINNASNRAKKTTSEKHSEIINSIFCLCI